MENNWFDIEIVTTTTKKWNISILIIFPLLIVLSFLSISYDFYLLVIIWAVIAGIFLFYELIHNKSIVKIRTQLLFKDDCFSIISNDNNINLQIKKEDVTNVKFDKKNNHIMIFQKEKLLYDFCVKPKILIELYDTFNSFGYMCEMYDYI